MGRWPTAAGPLLALLLASGCLGGHPGPSASPSPSPTAPLLTPIPTLAPLAPAPVLDLLLGFAFEDCEGVSLQQVQPAADVQALLPAGFTVASPAFAPGTAVVGLDLYACGNLTVGGASRVPHTVYGQVYTNIQSPSVRVPAAPNATFHEYVFRVLAGTDVLANLWPAAGYDTRNGTAAVSVAPPGNGSPLDVGLRSGNGTVGADYYALAHGIPPSTDIPGSGTFARYTALSDGSVLVWTGRYDFPRLYGGQGVFQVAPDDVFAGFEHAGWLTGLARLYEGGRIADQDLRRVFTPPPG